MTDAAVMPSPPMPHRPSAAAWQPVALAARLGLGAILPIRLNGQDLVLWRAESGEIAIWEDRCPHRGMRLSFGAVREASLLCPYHGWTFGTDGQCRHIPAHPGIRPSKAMRPITYAAAEAQGFIWANLGQPETVFSPHPALERLALTPIRTLHVPGPAETVAASLPPLAQLQSSSTSAALFARGEIEADGKTLAFVTLIQPCDGKSCALHIAAIGPAVPKDALRINSAFTLFRLDLAAEKETAP